MSGTKRENAPGQGVSVVDDEETPTTRKKSDGVSLLESVEEVRDGCGCGEVGAERAEEIQ